MSKYTENLMDHFTSPRNVGRMESPDCIGQAGTLGDGPFMVVYLSVRNRLIVDAKYVTHGCGATIASGSILTELAKNRTVEDCLELSASDVIDALGGMPGDKLHCPALAVAALHDALKALR